MKITTEDLRRRIGELAGKSREKVTETLQEVSRNLPWSMPEAQESPAAEAPQDAGETHLELARDSLRELIEDPRVPAQVREALHDDYAQVQAMLEKLEHGHIHIAAFGRVSVGKSATLNALLGEERFSTSPLHGETKHAQMGAWDQYQSGGVFLIDTPGLNEVDGEARERLAHEVVGRADLVLFIVDGDLTETEIRALRTLVDARRPVILALNKADRYTAAERAIVVEALKQHSEGLIARENIVSIKAKPAERLVIRVGEDGSETEEWQQPPPDVEPLRRRLWELLESEGQTLVALNASLFAGRLSDEVGRRILEVRRDLGEELIRTYAVSGGVTVAFNPIPLVDLGAAAAVDLSMVVHLSRVYGLPLSRSEASGLVKTVFTQMTALMGVVWATHLLSTALKLGTAGLSAVVTGGAQGVVAYYSTFLVGQATERYLAQGKSWGEGGPKQVVREILDGLDRRSILAQARADLRARLNSA